MQRPRRSPGAFCLTAAEAQTRTSRDAVIGGGLGIHSSLPLGPQQPPALPFPTALLFSFTLVVQLLAAGECQLELGAALVVEIKLERHQRHSLALDRTHEPVDLATVQQELADTLRRVVEATALQVFRDICVDEPDLTAARIGVGFRDRSLAAAQRFHLGAGKRDPGLEGLANLVVEPRLAILRDDTNLAVRLRGHPRLLPAIMGGGMIADHSSPLRTLWYRGALWLSWFG